MNRTILLSLLLFATLTITAQNSFNYNKWKAEQDGQKEKTEKMNTENVNILSPDCLYADGFVQAGSLRGPGVTLGGYYRNINLEASYIYGLVESYQVDRLFGDAHHAFTYTPIYFGIKAGYGLNAYDCLRITPQVGLGIVHITGDQANETADRTSEHGNAVSIAGGVKIEYAFTKHFGMFVAPEWQTAISTSETYDMFTDKTGEYVSPNSSTKDIENWTKGFRLRIGLEVTL